MTLFKSIARVIKWNDPKMCLQETLRFWVYLRIQFRLLNLGEGVKWICGFVNIISFRRHCSNLEDPFHLEGLLTLGFCYSHFGLLGSTEHLFPGEVPAALLSIIQLFCPIWKISKHANAINVCLLRTLCLFVCLLGRVNFFLF